MRHFLVVCVVLCVTGCSATPASLGITGPAPPVPPPVTDDSTIGIPGAPDNGNSYGPSIQPSGGGNGHYFNYN